MQNRGIKRTIGLAVVTGISLCFGSFLRADDLQFTTLPQTVQTTVIRETRIPDASAVTRIVRSQDGIYAITVRLDTGNQVIYVNDAGAIVQAPATTTTVEKTTQTVEPETTTVQKTTETVQPANGTEQTVVTYDQVQQSASRYQLLEKKGKKEVYLDRQTGAKVIVERDKD